MSETTTPPSLNRGILVIIPLLTAALLWWWLESASSETANPQEALQKLHSAIGLVENAVRIEDFQAAAQHFEDLQSGFPDQLMPLRNLVITRYLSIRATRDAMENAQLPTSKKTAAITAAIDAAITASDNLLRAAPQSAVAHLMAARVLLASQAGNDSAPKDQLHRRGLEYLQQAQQLDPSQLPIHYAIYEVASGSELPDLQPLAARALAEAVRVDPGNIAALRLHLGQQARDRDPTIASTLAQAKEATRSLREHLVRTGQPLDPWKYLDDATACLNTDDWPGVLRNATFFDNIVRPQDYARSDQLRCSPHALEYLVHDFDASFYEKYSFATAETPNRLEVILQPFAKRFPGIPAENVVDFRLLDFDLDDRFDVATLGRESLSVFVPSEKQESWSRAIHFPLETQYEHLLAADLYMVDDTKRSRKLSRPGDTPRDPSGPRHNTYMGFVLYGKNGLLILRNNLDRKDNSDPPDLTIVPQPEELAALTAIRAITAADLDHDGDLDLVISAASGLSLWFNRGNMTFVDMSALSDLRCPAVPFTSLVAVDWDRDVDTDVVLSGPDAQALGLLENLRHGQFRWRSWASLYPDAPPARAIVVAELDGNVSWDLVRGGATGLGSIRTTTSVPGSVQPLEVQQWDSKPYTHLQGWDYDNDGRRDVVGISEGGLSILRGDGRGHGTKNGVPALRLPGQVRQFRVADVDADGDQDLAILVKSEIVFYCNQGGNDHHWLDIRIIGKDDEQQTGRVNHFGIGSLLEINAGGHYQAQVVTEETTHFGLGTRPRADLARMLLTNGIPQGVVEPKANQLIAEPQVTKGSCPFIYTWRDGEFHFLTDCLWGAPIGLQVAEGTVVPGRPWEYLAVAPDELEVVNGHYRIKFTEELWEAAYFDHASLIIVDHPAEYQVYSNEKVGPASIAEHRIHAVRNPKQPQALVDPAGVSLAEVLGAADQRYARCFERKYRQGLVDLHHVQIDLGQGTSSKPLTLFLTGWIQPTDTSLNIAFSQNPELDGPQLPSLQVLDPTEGWKTIIPYLGFPGGKTKTIAIDLAGKLPVGSRYLRVVTSAEIYWDHIFYTIQEGVPDLAIQEITASSAHLGFRGFSGRLPRGPNGPELFTHRELSTDPLWPPMQGHFTRYGNVLPLIVANDDQMAILGSGDEMIVEFPAPPAPAEGWTRSFILHTVGWDKDADLNTVYGQSVEPLPFQSMTNYPYPPGEAYPTTAVHEDYVERYQTRRQHPLRFWRHVRNYTGP